MNRAIAIVFVLAGCDQVYNLTRPVDARVDDAASDAVDAPPVACDFDDPGPLTSVAAKGTSIIAGKFDAGDSLDLAVATTNSTAITFRFNDRGGFTSSMNVDVGAAPIAMARGDLNHDGLDDVAFATATTANGLLQTASTWDRHMETLIGGAPRSIAIANFNGTGLDDLLVAIPTGQLVQLVLAAGTIYLRGTSIPTSGVPVAAVAADVNGDLAPDVIAAFDDLNAIGVYLDAGPNFMGGAPIATGMKPIAIAAGRLGNRPVIDLVVVNEASDNVAILRNDGAGGFSVGEVLDVGDSPRAVVLADLDADGRTDIVVANNKNNSFSVLRGTDAGFEAHRDYTTVTKPVALAVGNFGGDDRLDVAILGEDDGFVIHTSVCTPL